MFENRNLKLDLVALALCAITVFLAAFCSCGTGQAAQEKISFDSERAWTHLEKQVSFGDRSLGQPGLEKEAFTISQDPSPYLLIKLGKPGNAVKTAEARLADDPNNFNARSHLGLILALAGDYARARPILEDVWQRGGELVTMTGIFPTGSAAALIAIRRNAGEESAIGELVAAIRDNVRRYHEAGITGATDEFSVNYEAGLAAFALRCYELRSFRRLDSVK